MEEIPETERLKAHKERKANWKKWGPYLSDRSWGTVREDYSYDGEAWDSFPHDHARSRAYRWGDDGIGGICDRNQYICFAPAFWNGKDAILKERFFGLIPKESNHGEDVKECYYYLDNTPTHSYMKMLYKYPQASYPYQELVDENRKRNSTQPEYELLDTGIFNDNRYFDIFIEYAKADQNDILIKITAFNRGPEAAPLHILPSIWFRNTWSWGYPAGPMNDVAEKPNIYHVPAPKGTSLLELHHVAAGVHYLYVEDSPDCLFTENESNNEKLYKKPNASPYVKDAFHRYLVQGEKGAVNPKKMGTKAAAHYSTSISSGGFCSVKLRLSKQRQADPFVDFDAIFAKRAAEAEGFYNYVHNKKLDDEERRIQRQAFAGMLWTKQFYYFDIPQWLEGDPVAPVRPIPRASNRDKDWIHLVNYDIISMPDKWEYPWYASWDLAFHTLSFVLVDPDFAKRQLILMTREWYMHPNGQIPAYEWNFSDVNPPVLAWAAWRVYKIDGKHTGNKDRGFLEAIFHKLLLNFTWWVNQKDMMGHNVFQGGFLGLDNISIFDRNVRLPKGYVDQADGTAWMGFYCMIMMKIALELSIEDPVYQDSATKFFEHFLRIASAMINPERKGFSLWDSQDGFFYDVLHLPDGEIMPLRIRSIVGLLPLFAVDTMDEDLVKSLPIFKDRVDWFMKQRSAYTATLAIMEVPEKGKKLLMATLTRDKLVNVLKYLFDENEFLSEYGIRSLSKYHEKNPYILYFENQDFKIGYEPGNSTYRLWGGGNSNWRGPIWLPINFLIIESLQKFHYYYGDELKVEYPTGSGLYVNLGDIATDLSKRLIKLFTKDGEGKRPLFGNDDIYQNDPHWKELLLFHEFFDGDNGMGLGSCHQTGWTGLIAKLLQQSG